MVCYGGLSIFLVLTGALYANGFFWRWRYPRGGRALTRDEIKDHPQRHPKPGRRRDGFIPPPAFDAAQRWSDCTSIRTIRNQGRCSTCWAVVAASVIADRLCVATGQDYPELVSSSQAAACSEPKRNEFQNCELPGNQATAFKRAAVFGLASGGEYGTNTGCVPYNVPPHGKAPIVCEQQCTNPSWGRPLHQDRLENLIDSYWINYGRDMSVQSNIDANVLQMQEEIFKNGPISAQIFDSVPDFGFSPYEPYLAPPPRALTGGHALRITGWNRTSDGVPYWIAANSWGEEAGDRGYFRIVMGKNVAGIEEWISAPIVDLSSTIQCNKSSFLELPIEEAMKMDPSDPLSPTYLFQGQCLLEVQAKNGTLEVVGDAVPIGKRIQHTLAPPISAAKIVRGQLWLMNSAGEANGNCIMPPGAHKYTCDAGTGRANQRNTALLVHRENQTIAYSYSGKNSVCFGPSNGVQRCTYIGTLFSKSRMITVTAFLDKEDYVSEDLTATQLYVFGKDASEKPLVGVLVHNHGKQSKFQWAKEPGPPREFLQR